MSFPQWKGLWDWSMKSADGTAPSGFRPEEVDPEKMKWLEDALKHYMVDFTSRMREIKAALERDAPAKKQPGRDRVAGGDDLDAGDDLGEREALLEELMDIVSSIDYARDLHKLGGLPTLLELLESPHPSIRWRAAEVVATCVANNPPVQQWFLEGGVLPKLLAMAAPSQPDVVRSKALLALSGLVRHFELGLQALREAGGIGAVADCLRCTDPRLARKAMSMLTYMLEQRRADCVAACQQGALQPLLAALGASSDHAAQLPPPDADAPGASERGPQPEGDEQAEAAGSSGEDSDLRQAALGALLQLAGHPDTWRVVRAVPGLQGRLEALGRAHLALPQEDRESQQEELGLLQRLGGLLADAAPPPLRPDEGDGISVDEFEGQGRDLTITVNDPAASAAATARDAGAGPGDQGAAGGAGGGGSGGGLGASLAGSVPRQGEAGGEGERTAPPLLLGPP
ncbi:Nucleotide exchange factor SIL1 [Tetrabaena socialis]|uniref:Nucleotide exchange factor SIL1 n=1 Tax=Tetrabaena socialis TaxID=47790 RepID=A0A2J8ABY4_9CHLO|nr:Nucleotide exchange factor SIL1 [Tetrabaena socialis]|eukprot:PNH10032.1 Nucleotide exchange factor SIL1 [Tetrabaena socialis]